MALLALGTIGLIAAVAFFFQMGVRKHEQDGQWRWMVDFASVGLVVGILGTALVALVYLPNLNAGIVIWGSFNPHAVFIVPWCLFALTVLRNRFRLLMLPALALLYGLSEVFFNALAFFGGWAFQSEIQFFTYPAWQVFFVAVLAAVSVGYMVVRPRFVFSPALLIFVAWSLIWLATGIRSIDNSLTGSVQNLPFDLAWQANMFMFGTWVMKPR